MYAIELYVVINSVDYKLDFFNTVDLNFRLSRFVQSSNDFQTRGGDTSTTLTIPATKNNKRLLSESTSEFGIDKFFTELKCNFVLKQNGCILLNGHLLITEITSKTLSVELKTENLQWVELLENQTLDKLGFVDGLPTWFGGEKSGEVFKGGKTINIINNFANIHGANFANRYTDYICPMLLRYNTPIADYLGKNDGDIFGVADGSGVQIISPIDFPNDYSAVNAYFGNRQGLTFDDFPPAIYYRNIIEKCFQTIGYSVDCSLFAEDWFNTLYVPFVGDFYKYNWKTLAELQLRFTTGSQIDTAVDGLTPPAIVTESYTDPTFTMLAYPYNLAVEDDLTQRVDYVANFKKFLVGDVDCSYIVPENGKYKIRFISYFDKTFYDSALTTLPLIDTFGSGLPNYGWDDNMFMIIRKNQTNEFVLRENPIADAINFMNGSFPEFTETPSDIVAYVSPKRCITLGNNDLQASGSPLTNFETNINVINRIHTIITDTSIEKSSLSSVTFEIEVDLLKNERIEFACLSIANVSQFPITSAVARNVFNGNNAASQYSIEYICSDFDDISLADNLPSISCKDFISNFKNFFNLYWSSDELSKTVKFYTTKEFTNVDNLYDISKIVDKNSVVITPTNPPNSVSIGYSNDDQDFLLNEVVSGCIDDAYKPTNYANYVVLNNKNIYSSDNTVFTNGFSATKFIEAQIFDCVDFYTINKTLVTTTIPSTTTLFTKGVTFGTKYNDVKFRLNIPSLQSIDSQKVKIIGDLEYDFNQKIRILQYLGTVGDVYNTLNSTFENYRFKIDSPDFARCIESDFWIEPTISSFDFETPKYSTFVNKTNLNEPTQSLRFDVYNGIYSKFYNNVVENLNKSHVLQCEAILSPFDWDSLTANTTVVYNNVLYKLLEIVDYDPQGINFAKIILQKIV